MPDSPQFTGLLARPLIEQCRRDIAAAWEQVEAGRRIMAHSRWLLKRWAEQARSAQPILQPFQPRLAGTFEPVETPRERLQPRRLTRARLRPFAAAAARRLHAPAGAPYPR